MRTLLLALTLAAASALGADVSGKWSGSFTITMEGQTRDDVALMVLTQSGTKIEGTVGPNAERQFPIRTGTIEGNKIKLEVVPTEGPAIVRFDLTLDGDRITGDAKAEGEGRSMTAKVDVKREK